MSVTGDSKVFTAKPNFLGEAKEEEEIIGLRSGSSEGPKWVVL